MHKNTKNLLDLLQDSMGVKHKKNLLPTLLNKSKAKPKSIQEELLEVGLNPDLKKVRQWRDLDNEKAIIQTKVSEIAYRIKQNEREFDKAALLEYLTEMLLKKKSCILALKLKQDKSDGVENYQDPLNELIPFTSDCKVVEFLLQLQNQEDQPYIISDFGKRVLHNKTKTLASAVGLPSQADYVFSDTHYSDRDKALSSFFVSYDNTSFVNSSWADTFDVSQLNSSINEQNRFNQELKGKSKPSNESDCMGALTRNPMPFQLSEPSGFNPFNINFEIPSLPQIPQFGQGIQEQTEMPSFSSNIRNLNAQTVETQPTEINWLTNKKRPLSPNKRQVKQKYKKMSRKGLLWSLMPYVDEDLLENNMGQESGIQCLWEDEELDIQMRNLSVSETGLITKQKIQQFQESFKEANENIIIAPGTRQFTEEAVISDACLMLQGIPSLTFNLEQLTLSFRLRDKFTIKGMALNKEALSSVFEELMEAGSYFLHLKEFTDYMMNPTYQKGQILENFVLSIQDFLTFYQNEINNIGNSVCQRREMEHQVLFNGEGRVSNRSMTMLELRLHVSSLINQIKILATICLTQCFIDSQKKDEQSEQMFVDSEAVTVKRHIFNVRNLKTQFQTNLDVMRNKYWQKEFPSGAKLLTYLYKILLCCESDLQAIDLLRRVFAKTIQPLLHIINDFIFTGEFIDPFSEFFVVNTKLVSVSHQSVDNLVYKITKKSQENIPLFMIDIASQIFKAGSQVHLLKRAHLFGIDATHLKEYYRICCGQAYNKFYTKLLNKEMCLEFQINLLKESQDKRRGLLQAQTEQLQDIEMCIVQEEEEQYYRQVILREEARREFIIKKEYQQQLERDQLRERKEEMMRVISQQVEEKQQERLKEKQRLIDENQKIKKEQEEYERRKLAIQEELKRQYLEIMKENQKLGDMRKEEVIAEEQLEQELKQVIEEGAQDSPKGNPQKRKGVDDVFEIVNNIGDVEMEVDPLSKDKQYLVGQGEPDNKLTQIITETTNEEVPMETYKPRSPFKIKQPIEEDQELRMDEIQLIQTVQTEAQSESLEEKLQIVQELFIQPLLMNIFERIEQKRHMETKRKTWVQRRKEERIEKVKTRKTQWKYQEPEVSIKSKLNQIFKDFSTDQEEPNQQQVTIKSENVYNVPVALAIRQCVISVVQDQYKIVNKCMLHMFFRRMNLLKHFEKLKQIFFCNQGDIISLFMQSIFNDDCGSTVKDNSIAFIQECYEISVKLNQSNSVSDSKDEIQNLGNCFKFGAKSPNSLEDDLNTHFYFNVNNMSDYVKLDYVRGYPLNLIVTDESIRKYNSIFFFLIRLKRVNQNLCLIWKYLNSSEFRRLPWKDYEKIKRIQVLRLKMQHFVSILEQYVLTEVISAKWQIFKSALTQIQIFEDIIKLHMEFLDQVLAKCFLDKKDHQVMKHINQMFEYVDQLNTLVKKHGPKVCSNQKVLGEVQSIETQFNKYTLFLYKLVKHMASKGAMNELYVMLDFNKYYDREQNLNA